MCRSRVLCVAEKADARAARTVVSFAVHTLAFVPTSVSDRSRQRWSRVRRLEQEAGLPARCRGGNPRELALARKRVRGLESEQGEDERDRRLRYRETGRRGCRDSLAYDHATAAAEPLLAGVVRL